MGIKLQGTNVIVEVQGLPRDAAARQSGRSACTHHGRQPSAWTHPHWQLPRYESPVHVVRGRGAPGQAAPGTGFLLLYNSCFNLTLVKEMDHFAACVLYRHILNPKQEEGGLTGHLVITASMVGFSLTQLHDILSVVGSSPDPRDNQE